MLTPPFMTWGFPCPDVGALTEDIWADLEAEVPQSALRFEATLLVPTMLAVLDFPET